MVIVWSLNFTYMPELLTSHEVQPQQTLEVSRKQTCRYPLREQSQVPDLKTVIYFL